MTPIKPHTSHAPQAVFALTLLLAAPWALADAEDTFSITPSIRWMHDDNFNRAPSSLAASDDITTSSLTLKVNKPYSLQRFELETSYTDQRYKTYAGNSFTDTPYKAAWRWSLTPYLHGNLTTNRAKTPYNSTDTPNTTGTSDPQKRILTTSENSRFDGVFDVSPSWHLLGGVSDQTITYSEFTLGNYNHNIKRVEAGIRHTFSTGSTLSYIARSGRGEYFDLPQIVNNNLNSTPFDTSDNELSLRWTPTGKTTVSAAIVNTQRSYDGDFSKMDYSGNGGNLNVNWYFSGESYLNAGLSRELASYPTASASYTSTDRFSLVPYWKISDKTALRGRYSYAQRDYLGKPGNLPASTRNDVTQTAMIALEWQALRTATLSATLQKEKQDSNLSSQDYDRNMLSVSAQIAF